MILIGLTALSWGVGTGVVFFFKEHPRFCAFGLKNTS